MKLINRLFLFLISPGLFLAPAVAQSAAIYWQCPPAQEIKVKADKGKAGSTFWKAKIVSSAGSSMGMIGYNNPKQPMMLNHTILKQNRLTCIYTTSDKLDGSYHGKLTNLVGFKGKCSYMDKNKAKTSGECVGTPAQCKVQCR